MIQNASDSLVTNSVQATTPRVGETAAPEAPVSAPSPTPEAVNQTIINEEARKAEEYIAQTEKELAKEIAGKRGSGGEGLAGGEKRALARDFYLKKLAELGINYSIQHKPGPKGGWDNFWSPFTTGRERVRIATKDASANKNAPLVGEDGKPLEFRVNWMFQHPEQKLIDFLKKEFEDIARGEKKKAVPPAPTETILQPKETPESEVQPTEIDKKTLEEAANLQPSTIVTPNGEILDATLQQEPEVQLTINKQTANMAKEQVADISKQAAAGFRAGNPEDAAKAEALLASYAYTPEEIDSFRKGVLLRQKILKPIYKVGDAMVNAVDKIPTWGGNEPQVSLKIDKETGRQAKQQIDEITNQAKTLLSEGKAGEAESLLFQYGYTPEEFEDLRSGVEVKPAAAQEVQTPVAPIEQEVKLKISKEAGTLAKKQIDQITNQAGSLFKEGKNSEAEALLAGYAYTPEEIDSFRKGVLLRQKILKPIYKVGDAMVNAVDKIPTWRGKEKTAAEVLEAPAEPPGPIGAPMETLKAETQLSPEQQEEIKWLTSLAEKEFPGEEKKTDRETEVNKFRANLEVLKYTLERARNTSNNPLIVLHDEEGENTHIDELGGTSGFRSIAKANEFLEGELKLTETERTERKGKREADLKAKIEKFNSILGSLGYISEKGGNRFGSLILIRNKEGTSVHPSSTQEGEYGWTSYTQANEFLEKELEKRNTKPVGKAAPKGNS